MPRVSVIIPSYESAAWTRGAVDSVLRQTAAGELEVVVVDDGSGPESAALLESLADPPRVRVLRQENRGPVPARRLGWEQARGDLVAFLDDDDRYRPRYVERCLHAFDEMPEAGAVYTAYDVVATGGAPARRLPSGARSGRIFRHEVRKSRVKTSTLMVRRRHLLELEGLEEHYRTSSEYGLVLRLCHLYPFRYVDEALVEVADRPGSVSKDLSQRHRSRARILEGLLRDLPDLERRDRRAVRDKIAKYYAKAGERAVREGRRAEARGLLEQSLRARLSARGLRGYLRALAPSGPRARRGVGA